MHFPSSVVKRAVPLPALPYQAREGLSAFAKTRHKTEMQRYRVERKVLCKSGTLPLVIKGSVDFTPALAALHLQGEIRKRGTIHKYNSLCGLYNTHS